MRSKTRSSSTRRRREGTFSINGGDEYTTRGPVWIDSTISDAFDVEMRVRDEFDGWGDWMPYSDHVAWTLPTGDGTFGPPTTYATGPYETSMALGDLDGDGNQDVAVANPTIGAVEILLGKGDGTFADKSDYFGPPQPGSVAIGDLDGDGILDLVTGTSYVSSVAVSLGNGDGTLRTGGDLPDGEEPAEVLLTDFDRDGALDLVAAHLSTAGVSPPIEGAGDGTLTDREEVLRLP